MANDFIMSDEQRAVIRFNEDQRLLAAALMIPGGGMISNEARMDYDEWLIRGLQGLLEARHELGLMYQYADGDTARKYAMAAIKACNQKIGLWLGI